MDWGGGTQPAVIPTMSHTITLSDSEVQILDRLLGLAEDATSKTEAFYLDDASAEEVSHLRETVANQADQQEALA